MRKVDVLERLPLFNRLIPPRVTLTDDCQIRERFERKLREYELRYQFEGRETTHHKIAVVSELLSSGRVREYGLRQKLLHEPWFNEDYYQRALGVISDYAKTGGENVVGGTGF